IRSIVKDRKGNTWIGCEYGLNRFDSTTGQFTGFTREDGLSGNIIEVLYEDSSGNLRIGTDAGLDKFRGGVFTAYNLGGQPGDNHIRCIHEDKPGVVWIGTDKGLVRLKNSTLSRYTIECGLIENYVYSILEDEKGYIWLGGQNGISRVSKKDLEDYSAGKINNLRADWYNEKDGMKSRWCTRSGCETRDGRFWFPTSMGIAMIDPNHIESPPLTTIIEKFIVDGKQINLQSKKPVTLSPGRKRLEFYYSAPSFINPQKIKFKIRLEGYDRNWIDMGTARSTNYTGLHPGYYKFTVAACNPDGIWHKTGTSFSFYLKPHFYQTSWFYLLAALFVLLAAFSIYRFRVRQLKNRQRELSALVELRTRDLKERTLELEMAHHNLHQSKEIIETKNRHIMDSIRYAQKIQHAMLPTKEKMARELSDYFVVFKPKDIVSGDFYWFNIVENQYFIAVADCTGHGVPGALLSMIGYLMLNEAINEKRILDPARALSHLHRGFRSVLKQQLNPEDSKTYDTYDGMDMGLCRIDLKTGKITFAGAGHSLFFVRDAKLIEIKGNRKSIGGRQREEIRTFTNHQIDFSDKDQTEIMIYMATDGFAHQHNPGNQKFGTRRLRKFLQDHAHLEASRQKETLVQALETHQANEEQRDDITVIGIRLGIG
ncbi:MAG: SpoIIE family protein phosphatase, partial [Candidatus Aminicenantes bacterium]